ncbi:MAG: UDP-N-acetylmuramate--L-alanine ligase [Gammaproteobacteria bacterium]|jgi:UDP-N-acetylmuramate--alanine ligase|nr:UDP-N-acetylmuramate--L-alanine ligase [Gammaproteobacteria bacterium]
MKGEQAVHISAPMRRIRRIHFVGIGGAGMSGIAEVLHNLGYQVSGSDLKQTAVTKRLSELGIEIKIGHRPEYTENANVVVTSSAISPNNPEVQEAVARHIPVIPRAQMLAELMRFKTGITVAGTHGKTTTTSLLANIFGDGGLKPTFVVGGKVNSTGTNARLGDSRYFIAEADESDASFLYLTPTISVVTNIDADHMVNYQNDFNILRQTFIQFIRRLPFYGLAVLCIDDDNIRAILPEITCSVLTYGFSEDADLRIEDFEQNGMHSRFTLVPKAGSIKPFSVNLNLAGKHNALNAAAAAAIALDCEIPVDSICKTLQNFSGIGRRCQVYGQIELHNGNKVMLIDDYGHHPREISVTYEALKNAWPGRRVVLAYQPHRYSRTQELFDDFANVLSGVDTLVMLEVYAAGEEPISGADSKALCRAIRSRGKVEPLYVENIDAALDLLPNILQDGDILVSQGAGDVDQIIHRLSKQFGGKQ